MKKNKTALVVGGSGGIGFSISKKLSSNNFKVHSTYHKNKKIIKDKDIIFHNCDVTKEDNLNNTLNLILEKNNHIDLIVFTVSPNLKNMKILDLDLEQIYYHIDLQVMSLFRIIKFLKKQFEKKNKTKIVVILTEYCFGKPPKSLSHYITSKYALMGLAKCLSVELADFNCNVNMISPGMVDTELIKNLPPKLIELTAYQNPLKRIASPEDISELVLFLSSSKSDYINGVNIPVNGGNLLS